MKQRFELGEIVITRNANNLLKREDVISAIQRHAACDWGESKDKKLNDSAVENNDDRVISVYRNPKGEKFWVITEADRSATTVLLPEDY